MAQRKQFLINLHTNSVDSTPSELRFGEIAVRYADEKPELIIKKEGGDFATFIDSGAIHTIVNQINLDYTALEGRVAATEANISGLSASVVTNYATKEVASGYATTAKSEAIEAAKTETTTQVKALSAAVVADIDAVEGRVAATEANISGLSASVVTMKEDLEAEIANKVSSAYIYQGSCTYAELLLKTDNTIGDVWNVTDEHTVNDVKVPAGTNYAWSKGANDGEAKWDALAGIVDMSKYTLVSDFEELEGRVVATEANISSLSASVVTNYATKEVASGYATTAKSEAIEAAKTETTTQVKALSAAVVADIEAVEGRVDALELKSLNAIESITISNLSGVTGTYTGSAVTIDFKNMIIDCGTF